MQNWILPEYIADVLPAEARQIEDLRRIILDSFRSYGYELVMPPMLEYLESLLTVAGQDTDLYTFRLIDQLSGRTMGVRADMTTQVARIDAHLLNRTSVTRLCYVGSVLHARPSGLFVTREPLQIGAEIYGHSGVEADAEIHEMTRVTLSLVGISSLTLDLGHVGILRTLLEDEPELKKREFQVIQLLEIKDLTGIAELKPYCKKTSTLDALLALPNLYGNADVLKEARFVLPKSDGILRALDDLDALADLSGRTSVTIDLADTRGYEYHSGVNFAAYVPGLPNALARGGRYDHIGEVFGRARPATGFSMDLRELAQILPSAASRKAIRAPWGREPELLDKIISLRMQGEIVIQDMPGQTVEPDEFVCDSALVLDNGVWVVKPIN